MRKELSSFQKIFFTTIFAIFIVFGIFILFNITVGKSLKELKATNTELESQVERLQQYVVNMENYRRDTDILAKNIDTLVNRYEQDTTPVATLHDSERSYKEEGLESGSLTFQKAEVIDSVSYTYQDQSYTFDLQRTSMAYNYRESYDDLMKTLGDFSADLTNKSPKSINMAPDPSDGSVMGSINLVKYTINGATREEIKPEIDIPVGVDKIFDTTMSTKEKETNYNVDTSVEIE